MWAHCGSERLQCCSCCWRCGEAATAPLATCRKVLEGGQGEEVATGTRKEAKRSSLVRLTDEGDALVVEWRSGQYGEAGGGGLSTLETLVLASRCRRTSRMACPTLVNKEAAVAVFVIPRSLSGCKVCTTKLTTRMMYLTHNRKPTLARAAVTKRAHAVSAARKSANVAAINRRSSRESV